MVAQRSGHRATGGSHGASTRDRRDWNIAAPLRRPTHPAPALETTAGKLAGYALMVDAAAKQLRAALAMLVAHGAREGQEGAMPPAQQALLDEAHRQLR